MKKPDVIARLKEIVKIAQAKTAEKREERDSLLQARDANVVDLTVTERFSPDLCLYLFGAKAYRESLVQRISDINKELDPVEAELAGREDAERMVRSALDLAEKSGG